MWNLFLNQKPAKESYVTASMHVSAIHNNELYSQIKIKLVLFYLINLHSAFFDKLECFGGSLPQTLH